MPVIDVSIAANSQAPANARRIVRDELRVPRDVARDVELMTSELVAAALRHHGDTPIGVVFWQAAEQVRVEIRGAAGWPAALLRRSDLHSEYAVRVLTAIAGQWGAENDARGASIWFETAALSSEGRASSAGL